MRAHYSKDDGKLDRRFRDNSARDVLLRQVFAFILGVSSASLIFFAAVQSGSFDTSPFRIGRGDHHAYLAASHAVAASTPRPFALLLGDSLTQRGFEVLSRGWAAQLSDRYSRRMDVLNRGFSGYNSRWLLHILPGMLRNESQGQDCRFVTLWIGANDAVLPEAKQYVPLEEFKRNVAGAVALLRKAFPKALLLLLTPPPADVGAWAKHRSAQQRRSDRSVGRTARYAAAVREVAREAGKDVVLLDVHKAFGGADGAAAGKFLLSDGVHLGPSGSDAVVEEIMALLAVRRPDLLPSAVRQEWPDHRKIDATAWESSLDVG